MVQEVVALVGNLWVELEDPLLMFIYAEVLGMLGASSSRCRIPITIPLFIAMTALSRLLILQGQEGDPSTLIYERGAILLIAVACRIVSHLHAKDSRPAAPPRASSARRVTESGSRYSPSLRHRRTCSCRARSAPHPRAAGARDRDWR